ncbi:hypothetical protein GGI25_000667 [Coemansia spiralis]|uniref:Endonuclease/exonuclease/phosphatase domain-containing protein n=2 Tax=Coemansia TaxID=4863 RepID=A0A9W8GC35_9FUNG|nr:hypothetical protein EDC05_000622 [Coemansia umbellata]KAJ2623707.1 hypothetical protein GGI26_002154 [Coemansia sp. RSA 1358]KAJ2680375.1 hypothetical protein GGI25_000667 [Coemansia spiralis]
MSGTKRPAVSDENSQGDNATKAKKAMLDSASIPTNKTMPKDYGFIKQMPSDCLKIVSFNVNSLPAACKKGFKEYVAAENPDVICMQETKVNQPMAFLLNKEFPHQYWHCSKAKKGYAGTAIFSKIKPMQIKYGLGDSGLDDEGRMITLEFSTFHLVASYVPNAGEKLVRLERKIKWGECMNEYLVELENTKPVVYTGDLNVAHHPIDLARPESNKRSAGFTVEERDGFTRILKGSEAPRIDTFRALYPDAAEQGYTYFGYRGNCREKSIGWRLDYFVVSEQLMPRVLDVIVRNECYGASDHVPLVLLLKKDKSSIFKDGAAATEIATDTARSGVGSGHEDNS